MKMLGLDVGDRTIGVAVSDPTGFLASPVETIKKESNKQSIARIVEMVIETTSEKIIVGLPKKNMNGTIGPQGEKKRLHLLSNWKRKLSTLISLKVRQSKS